MRGALIRALTDLAAADDRVMLLTGDLGYTVVEPFVERFPARFLNVGVAEQNMVGVATGLAEAGFIPFVYSIATFAALRPYEFIRNGPVLHGLPVRVIGVGGGFDYGPAGPSHHALEDIAVMRALPGLAVLSPADAAQCAAVIAATRDLPGPAYIRIGKDDRVVVPGLDGQFRLGRAELIRSGSAALVVTMGAISAEAAAAVDLLAAAGIQAGLLVVASVSPPPSDDLARELARVPLVFAVEEHGQNGGLGSLVAEVIAERGIACRLVRAAVGTTAAGPTGSDGWLRRRHGLDREALAARLRTELRKD